MKNLITKGILCLAILINSIGSAHAGVDHMDNVAIMASMKQEVADREKAEKAAPDKIFLGIPDVIRQFGDTANNKMSGQMYSQGIAIAKATGTWAKALAGSLALLYFVVEGFAFMGGKNSSIKASLVEIAVPVAFCSYLLGNYETLINDFAGTTGLLQYIRDIAFVGGGEQNPINILFENYKKVLSLTTESISASSRFYVTSWLSLHPLDTLTGLADLLLTAALALIIIFIALTGFAELVGLLLLGPFLCAIAIAFGPIFIAGLVSPWTRDYFIKWMGFLVGSAVLSGVIGVCIQISSVLFLVLKYDEYALVQTPTAMNMLTTLIIIVTVNSLISQAPTITSALIPGSIGASKGGGGEISKFAGSAGKLASASAKDAAKLIKGASKV